MRTRPRRKWAILAVMVLAVGVPLFVPPASPVRPGDEDDTGLEGESMSDVAGGMRVRIRRLRRQGSQVEITYVCERGEQVDFDLPATLADLRLSWYDAWRDEIRPRPPSPVGPAPGADFCQGPAGLSGVGFLSRRGLDEWLLRRSSRFEASVIVAPPPDACYVQMSFDRLIAHTGGRLITKQVKLPE